MIPTFRFRMMDDPYADIVIETITGLTICKFPLDDAPVHDFNAVQRRRARHFLSILNGEGIE